MSEEQRRAKSQELKGGMESRDEGKLGQKVETGQKLTGRDVKVEGTLSRRGERWQGQGWLRMTYKCRSGF